MEFVTRFTFPGILFILTLTFGFRLNNIGKPYNGLLFNLHKLIALGGVVVAIVQLTKIPNLLTPFSLVAVGLTLAALSILALFVSRALMSAGKLDYALMLSLHRLGLAVLVIGCTLALYGLGLNP